MAKQVDGVEFSVEVDTKGAKSQLVSLSEASEDLGFSLENVDKKSTGATKSIKKTGDAATNATRGLGGLSRNAGQAGIQIQQLVGQVQGGQSVMLALSQQAADLGIVLGAPLLGAIAGLSASFAGILLPSLFNSKTAIEELAEASEKLDEVLSKSDKGAISFSKELLNLSKISQSLARVKIAKGLIDAQKVIEKATDGIDESLDILNKLARESATAFSDGFEQAGLSIDDFTKKIKENEDVGISSVQTYTKSRDALRTLEGRFGLTAEQAGRLALAIGNFNKDANPITAQRLSGTLENLSDETGNTNTNLINLTNSLIPYVTGLSEAIDQTNALKVAQSGLSEAISGSESGEGITSPSGSNEKSLEEEEEDLQARLEMSQAFADAELQQLFDNIEREMAAKKDADAADLLREKRKQLALSSITRAGEMNRMNLVQAFATTLLNQNLSTQQKLIEIVKDGAAAAIQAYGLQAAARAVAELGYPVGLIESARITAWSQVAASVVKAIPFGGGSTSTAQIGNQASSQASTQQSGSSEPTRIVNIQGLNPSELVSGRQVIDLINEAQADGARITIGG